MNKVQEFREAVNENEEWQKEVRNFGAVEVIKTPFAHTISPVLGLCMMSSSNE